MWTNECWLIGKVQETITQPNREIYNKTMLVRVLCRKIYYIGKMNKKIYNKEAKLGSVWYMCLKTKNCCLKTFVEIRVREKVR